MRVVSEEGGESCKHTTNIVLGSPAPHGSVMTCRACANGRLKKARIKDVGPPKSKLGYLTV